MAPPKRVPNRALKSMNVTELSKLLDELPPNVKWDIVQLALDVAGLVNPAADAASALISLVRGDLLGAAIGAASIIPVGDVAKVLKLGKFADSVATVVKLSKTNPRLARILEAPLRQISDFLNAIVSKVGANKLPKEVKAIRKSLDDYFLDLKKLKAVSGATAGHLARSKGVAAGQWPLWRGGKRVTINVDTVVDMLEEAVKGKRHPAAKYGSRELLDRMAKSKEWKITAPPHKKGDPGSTTKDATQHFTIKVDDGPQIHVRLNKQGQIFHVTEKVKVTRDGRTVEIERPLGDVQPWMSPGTPIGD